MVSTKLTQVNLQPDHDSRDTYDVIAGQSQLGGHQTSDVSWWPKPAAFVLSGLSVGYWSEDCERWFQKRLDQCKSGTAVLYNPGSWKHNIRFSKPVKDIAQKNDQLAASFFNIMLQSSGH